MRAELRPRPVRGAAASALPPVVAFAVLIAIFELIAETNPLALPSVQAVASDLWHAKGLLIDSTARTLEETAIGLSIGAAGAMVIAVAMSQVRLVERALMPLAVVLNVTPLVALAPALALGLGFGIVPKFVVTAIIVFFPFLVNVRAGLVSADPEALEVLRTVAASRREILWRLQLPSSLPFVFAASRICAPLALVGAVVAELTVSSSDSIGLGSQIRGAIATGPLARIYAAVWCLAVTGTALFLAVVVLERRTLGRYRADRSPRR